MGFGREMKDFIAAMSAGEKMVSNFGDREYKRLRQQLLKTQVDKASDPQRQKLEKDILARRAAGPQARPILPVQAEYMKENTRRLKLQNDAASAPAAANPMVSDAPSFSQPETTEIDPELNYAGGGAVEKRQAIPVRHYEDGGAVDAAVDPEDESQDDDLDDGPGFSYEASHDAAREGIQYAMKATGADGGGEAGAIPTDSSSAKRGGATRSAYLGRAGASTQDEMDAIRSKIDPQGKMTESQRNMAALSHVYMYNLKNNNPEGAKRASASMMQYYGHMADRYQALAKVAAESGNVDATVQNLLRAHANIPDGMDLRVVKRGDGSIAYTYQDEKTGKSYEKGILSPDQIVSFATKGLVSMEQMVAQAAGTRAGGKGGAKGAPKGEKAPAVRKLDERDSASSAIDGVIGDKYKLDPDMAPGVKHLAGQIISGNDIPPEDAMDIVGELSRVGEEPTFKMTRSEDGSAKVEIGGRSINLSRDAFGNLAALRGKAQVKYNEANKKKASDEEQTAKRGALQVEKDEALKGSIRNMGGQALNINAP
jgi:hypothetical protein